MSRIEFNVVALGDFSSVNAQLASLRKNVAGLNAQLVGLGVSTDVAASMSAMNAQFKASLLSSGAFTAKTVQLTAETEKFGQALTSGKLKLSQYFAIIKAGAAQSTAEMRALAMEQAKLANSMVVADPLKRGVFSVLTPTHINAVTNATKIATIQQNLYNIAVQKGSVALINWGKNTQWAGRQMTVGLSMPIIMFGAVASKAFADVTQEIVRMQKVYGEGITAPTSAELDKISGQVKMLSRELASSWGTAAKDTAKMAADLAATGLTGSNLIGATKEGMRLSKLGELDQEASLTAVISLQNVYKLSTNELTKSIDFLNAVENQTSTSLQDLADSIPKVGPIVKQLGGDFKDTAAMIVALKEAGVPAGQAANAIKSSLASILNPTKAAREAFAGFGIDVAGIATVTGGKPVEMLQLLNRELSKLEPLSRAQLIEKMFGKYQFARVSALLDNMNRLGTQTQTVFGLMGATDAQLAKMSDRELKLQTQSATGKFKIAIETIKADLVPIGERFIKIFTMILQGIDKFIHAFDKLGPIKNFIGVVLGIGLVVGPMVMLAGVFANFLGYVAKGILGLTNFAKGGTHIKELLTAQSVAAAQASELMTKSTMKEAEIMQLVTKAVTELNMQMEKLIGLKTTASSASMLATGFTPNGIPIAAPMNAAGTAAAKMQMAHMVNPLSTFSLKQAVAYADAGAMKVNGEVVKLSETMIRDIRKIQAAVDSGLLTAEQAAKIKFSALSNSVIAGQGTVNRAMMGSRAGVSGQNFIQKEIFAGNLAPQMALANARGANVGAAAAAQLEMRFNSITKTLVETDTSYKMINNKNREVLTRDVLGKLEKDLMLLDETTNPLKQEMLRYLSQIKISGTEVAKLGVNVGSAAVATKLYEQKAMTAFAGGTGRSDYRLPVPNMVQYSSAKLKITSAEYANLIRQEYMKLEQVMAEGDAKIQSRLSKSKITLGMAYKEGLQKAIAEAQVLIRQGVDVDVAALEEQVRKNVPKAKLAGMTLAEAFNAGYKQAGLPNPNAPVVAAKTPGMGLGMGASMGLMAGSVALSSTGAKGVGADVAQGAMSMGAMGAMAGMMIAGGAYLLPILAATVAIGGLIALIKHLKDEEKKHELMVVNSMKASASAFDIFGGEIKDTTSHIYTFAQGAQRSATQISALEKNIDAIKGLKEDDPFRQMADSLKGMDGSALIGTVRQFAAAQVSNGMDPKKVNDMVAALLTYAGKAQYVSAAQKSISASTKDTQTATETWINKLNSAADAIGYGISNYDDLNKRQQAYADGLLSVSLSILDINTPVEMVIGKVQALESATKNSTEAFKALIMAAQQAGQLDFANVIGKLQNLGMSVGNAMMAAKLNQVVPMPQDSTKHKVTEADFNAWLQNPANWVKALSVSNSVQATSYNQQKSQMSIQDQIKALEKQKKAIDDQIAAQKANTAELKRQNDFKLKQADLSNQIKVAEASGDYLKANLLRQDMVAAKFDLQSGDKTPLEIQSEALAKKIESLQDSSEKISRAMSQAALDMNKPKTPAQIAAEAKIYSEMFKNSPLFAKGTAQNPLFVKVGKQVDLTDKEAAKDAFSGPKKPMSKLVVPSGYELPELGTVQYFKDEYLTAQGKDYIKNMASDLKDGTYYRVGDHIYKWDAKKEDLVALGSKQEDKIEKSKTKVVTVGTNAQTGRVTAGNPTWVGEVRPELFIPDSNGYMINPTDLQSRFSRSSYDVPGMQNYSTAGLAGSSTNNSASTIINNFEISHPDGSVIVDAVMRKINLVSQKSGTITKIGYEA